VLTSYGGALLTLGEPARAIEVLEDPSLAASFASAPLPGLLARRHLGRAYCHAGREAAGYETLATSVVVYGRALEPHLSFLAHVNVLGEALERLAAGAWTADIAGRARRACEHVPQHGDLPTFLGAPLRRFERSLAQEPHEPSLRALLVRCERLS
jgi:hypothetical protein